MAIYLCKVVLHMDNHKTKILLVGFLYNKINYLIQ